MAEEQTTGGDEPREVDDTDASQGENPRPSFDPNKIRVKKIDPTVSNLMDKLSAGEIDLAPEFQRRKGVWDANLESKLIESLLIRIPLPALYLDELDNDEHYAVIDGVQRLSALDHFINRKGDAALVLCGLEVLPKLNGETFEKLDPPLKRRILGAQLVAYVIERGTPDEAKLNIFARINTLGMALTLQEVRHAMNPGPVRKFLRDLTEAAEFTQAIGKAANWLGERMTDRECAIRFVAFIDGGVERYDNTKTDLHGFLNTTMRRVNKMSAAERESVAKRFLRAMHFAHSCFGRQAFRLPNMGGRLNKSLFEATAVALDRLSDQELDVLASRKDRLLEVYAKTFEDPKISYAVRVSTGDPNRVKTRFEAMQRVLSEVLQ